MLNNVIWFLVFFIFYFLIVTNQNFNFVFFFIISISFFLITLQLLCFVSIGNSLFIWSYFFLIFLGSVEVVILVSSYY